MKFKNLLLLTLAAVLTLATPRPARALEVSFEFFQDSLSPYGEWIEVGDYGYCWRPTGVDEDWAPYSDGYWSYTDAGWTWVSYEEFGGIVYHYGRWTRVEDEGWCWVPDYEWGPAWVSWRKNDDYVGWAPLPAEARWQRERGISVWADTSYDIGPSHYSFCRSYDFGAPVLRAVLLPRRENVVIIHNTVNITNITYNNDARCVFNGGLDYGYVNRFSHRQVPALKLVRNTNITVVNNHIVNNNVRVTNINSVQKGNQLTIIAPTVVRPERERLDVLLKPKVTKVIDQKKVMRGWGSVPADERAAIRAQYQQQTEGKTPDTLPAKPMRTADVKVVPVKADPKAKLPTINRNVPEQPPIAKLPVPGRQPPGTPEDQKIPATAVTAPGTTPPNAATPPPATEKRKTAAEIARERNAALAAAKQQAMEAKKQQQDAPTAQPGIVKPFDTRETDNAPTGSARMAATPPPATEKKKTAAEIARERYAAQAAAKQQAMEAKKQQDEAQAVRPGIVKPFNPRKDDNAPTGNVRMVATPPPATEKKKTAAEIARERYAAQAAAKQQAMESKNQQEEIAQRNKAQEAATARTRMLQQQQQQKVEVKPPTPPVTRKRTVEPPPVQQNQQQQEMLRERAAQAAEAKQRSLQMQQSQAAAARQQAAERSQAQAAAREQAAQAAQVQKQRSMPPPVQRQVAPPSVQRQVPPAVQQQRVPVKPGKKPLTPEEAALLQQQQLR